MARTMPSINALRHIRPLRGWENPDQR
jgi:hypothetical protein